MRAWVGMGSNLGDRAETLLSAFEALKSLPGVQNAALSPCYETAPLGPPQPAYLNACARLEGDFPDPAALLGRLQEIEARFGRQREVHWGPRTLDLDLLLVDDRGLPGPGLVLPHPGLAKRRFVLRPLADLDPELRVPGTGRTVSELLSALPGSEPALPWPRPELLRTAAALAERVAAWKRAGETVALVPTMGALHEGHLSLLRKAREECRRVVLSIFVNPTQFGPQEDFAKYPRTLDADLALCGGLTDAAYVPEVAEIYPEGEAVAWVEPGPEAEGLCGRFRPGHFRGVLTVVATLFRQASPDRAYFGRKDYQQAVLIRSMARGRGLPVQVVLCPIVREPDGLAMSSRNRYLTPPEREQALCLVRGLRAAERRVREGVRDAARLREAVARELAQAPQARTEYIEIVHPDTLTPMDPLSGSAVIALAVRIGATRLIDNLEVAP